MSKIKLLLLTTLLTASITQTASEGVAQAIQSEMAIQNTPRLAKFLTPALNIVEKSATVIWNGTKQACGATTEWLAADSERAIIAGVWAAMIGGMAYVIWSDSKNAAERTRVNEYRNTMDQYKEVLALLENPELENDAELAGKLEESLRNTYIPTELKQKAQALLEKLEGKAKEKAEKIITEKTSAAATAA